MSTFVPFEKHTFTSTFYTNLIEIMATKLRLSILFLLIILSGNLAAQRLSSNERKMITNEIEQQKNILSRFSYENPDILPVYSLQLITAEDVLKKYEKQSIDYIVFESWFELKALIDQNKEIIDFMLPRTANWMYQKGLFELSKKNIPAAEKMFNKTLEMNSKHVLANYQLAKIDLDSGKIVRATSRMTMVYNTFNLTEDEKRLVTNLLDYAYNKNFLYAMSLSNQGKYAYALDVFNELNEFCQTDPIATCKKEEITFNINKCRQEIYNAHLKIAERALSLEKNMVADNFAATAYEYFSENRSSIKDTSGFSSIAKRIAENYLEEAKKVQGDRKAALQSELLDKAKYFSSFVDTRFANQVSKEVEAIAPPKSKYAQMLDTIGEGSNPKTYKEKYGAYVVDNTKPTTQKDIDAIEKKYISEAGTAKQRATSLKQELDDKFYETRSYLSVNSYEKALQVLESANRLATISSEKRELDDMYRLAIREITAKRMSQAEYLIWQGKQRDADSLINMTNELIGAYKMQDDPEVIKIMQSYLEVLDKKVCAKKQDEINGFVYNIMDCVKREDFYCADSYIRKGMSIRESEGCTLDKSKLENFRTQLEKPLEYINIMDGAYKALNRSDTTAYIQQYGAGEEFYNTYGLASMGVQHVFLRNILVDLKNENFILNAIEILVRYKEFKVSVEVLGALKDLGYSAWETSSVQKRIAKLMTLDMYNKAVPEEEAEKVLEKYENDKWFRTLCKEYKSELKKRYKKADFKK